MEQIKINMDGLKEMLTVTVQPGDVKEGFDFGIMFLRMRQAGFHVTRNGNDSITLVFDYPNKEKT